MANIQRQHWQDLEKLILIAGHAIHIADDFERPESDDSWFLQNFQKGEPPFYIEHIICGVEIATTERTSLLIFSGGQTRFEAGPRSEAQSYWMIANHFAWWQKPSIRLRAYPKTWSLYKHTEVNKRHSRF